MKANEKINFMYQLTSKIDMIHKGKGTKIIDSNQTGQYCKTKADEKGIKKGTSIGMTLNIQVKNGNTLVTKNISKKINRCT